MAWTLQGEEVWEALSQYVTRLDAQKKAELGHIYGRAVNPFSGEWTNLDGVTFVNLRNRENVWDNLGLAMFKEAIGLGTYHYCIIQSYYLDFENLLMLTLLYCLGINFVYTLRKRLLRVYFCTHPRIFWVGGFVTGHLYPLISILLILLIK